MKKTDYRLQLDAIHSGFDSKTCWVHARGGMIPGKNPRVVVTTQKLLLEASDVFYALNQTTSDDLGKTWSSLVEQPTLGRRDESDGSVGCICDFTPQWHSKTGCLLGTGQVARYVNNRIMPDPRPRHIAYSVLNQDGFWATWHTVETPNEARFFSVGAGSTQRVDLANGDILLPVYMHSRTDPRNAAAVMRCGFDGTTLTMKDMGDELVSPGKRGSCEPSLAEFEGRYFMTIRDDEGAFVAQSQDGMHFDEMVPWRYDDGALLGSYNTQAHWVTHSNGLFLTYTRRGADNDHVFRHRAPLFMAQVDPERMCIVRETERIVVPERGARLGNFGICNVSSEETWIFDAEWMQPLGCEQYGSDNTIWLSRILWNKPNELV